MGGGWEPGEGEGCRCPLPIQRQRRPRRPAARPCPASMSKQPKSKVVTGTFRSLEACGFTSDRRPSDQPAVTTVLLAQGRGRLPQSLRNTLGPQTEHPEAPEADTEQGVRDSGSDSDSGTDGDTESESEAEGAQRRMQQGQANM